MTARAPRLRRPVRIEPEPLTPADPLEIGEQRSEWGAACGESRGGLLQRGDRLVPDSAPKALEPDQLADQTVAGTPEPEPTRAPADCSPRLRHRDAVAVEPANQLDEPRVVSGNGEAHEPRVPEKLLPKSHERRAKEQFVRNEHKHSLRALSTTRLRAANYQPRVSSNSLGSSVEVEIPTIASPRPAETRARISASA